MAFWNWLMALSPFAKAAITGVMIVLIIIVLFVGKNK